MVLETENTEVQTTLEGKTFKIEDNTVLYNILSDRMYKNKIRAVVRELSTNAVDAQIAVDNADTPISVTLPTILEPTFTIRDYGIGLSEEDVMNLYTTYGSSTKRDSNLFNGALGLGSKSPFAYSKAFTVTSYWKGTKFMFSVYSDNGVPKIAKLGEQDTTEPNGLEISIPVQDIDINTFYHEANFVYKFFSAPVKCSLDLGTPIKDLEPEYGKNNWGVYKLVRGSWLVMANVAYKLDDLGIDGTEILSTRGLVVNVPIGTVQFSASREELSLTPDTIAYLQKLGTRISADVTAIVDEASASIDEGDTSIGNIIKVANALPINLRKTVGDKLDYIYVDYSGAVQVTIPRWYTAKMIDSWRKRYFVYGHLKGEQFTSDNYLFVFTDVKNHMNYIEEVESRTVIFITSDVPKTKENAKERFTNFIEKFGLPKSQYKFASDYALPTKKSRTKPERKKATPASNVKEVFTYSWDALDNQWTYQKVLEDLEEVVEKAENVYAVTKNREKWKTAEGRYVGQGTEILASCLEYNTTVDKSKNLTFVVYTPNNYDKYAKKVYPFWTDLLPKKVVVTDLRKATKFMFTLGFDVQQEGGAYTLEKPLLKHLLPRDLESLINKMSKTKNPFDTSSEYRDLGNITYLAGRIGKKDPVVIKTFEYGNQLEKYEKIIDTHRHSASIFFGNIATMAVETKAWDMSYNKLKKLAKGAYGITD